MECTKNAVGFNSLKGIQCHRSYYRCTYRLVQNCWATKQVQRSDDDPTIFEITYKGKHTCNLSMNANNVAAPSQTASPEKQERVNNDCCYNAGQQNQTLENLRANLRVNTENLDDKGMPTSFSFSSTNDCYDIANQYFPVTSLPCENHLGASYSPLFPSPATSESTYFSPAAYQMNSFGGAFNYQNSESNIAEILSANASTSNSPIGGVEFPIDHMDPNFPFNTAGFFT